MSTTALSAVNAVLARLRETALTSTTFTSNVYGALILRFVNEAKREVEDAWDWTQLRQTIPISTAIGTSTYTVTGAGQRFRFYDRRKVIWNATTHEWIYQYPQGQFEEAKWNFSVNQQHPAWYRIIGLDGTGIDPIVELYPTPDAVYALKFPFVVPQADLVLFSDTFNLPLLPVELGAWARAISERGEDGGTSTDLAWQLYRTALSDYVAMNQGLTEDETVWMTV
jgi:hypothetical protein